MTNDTNTRSARGGEASAMKPCPWCRGVVEPIVEEGTTFRWRRVTGCCAEGPEVRHDTLADDQAASEVESRAKAIDAWNTRPVEDTLRAQLEAAEAECRTRREDYATLTALWKADVAQLEARAEAAEADAGPTEIRKVAKRNLRSMIERGSDDRELMLKCLEELS